MKKFLLTLCVIFLAYYTAYITSGAYQNQKFLTFGTSPLFYKIYCVFTGSTDTTSAESLNKRALSYKEQQNYELAINDFKKVLALDSTFSSAYYDLAKVYIAKGDSSMAIKTLSDYAKTADYPDNAYFEMGQIYSTKGMKDSTIFFYNKAIEANKSNHNIYYQLANIYYLDSSINQALENINLAIGQFESDVEYRNLRRLIYLKQNQLQLAAEEYQYIVGSNPEYFGQFEANAKLAYDRGDYRIAIENYKLALINKPFDRVLLEAKAWAYVQLFEYDSSYMDYKMVTDLEPDYLSYFNLAYILDIQGKIKESIEAYGKSIELKNDYHISYNNRGYEYFKLKKFKEAEKDYTRSIELKPDYYLNNYNRALLYAEINKHDKAIIDYLNALKYENMPSIHYDLALSYDKLKKKDETIGAFNEYLKLAGESDSIRVNYATERITKLNSQ